MATKTQEKTTSSTQISAPRVRSHLRLVPRESLLSVEQWVQMPDVKPPYELIAGKLVQKMVKTNEHDWITSRFKRFCDEWADRSGWRFFSQGSGAAIGEHDGFIPDVMGFSPDTKIEARATYNPAPFLVVEVLSRGTKKVDRNEKKSACAQAGVKLYLLIDPDKKTLEVFTLKDGKYAAHRVLENGEMWQPIELAGLTIEVEKLWFK